MFGANVTAGNFQRKMNPKGYSFLVYTATVPPDDQMPLDEKPFIKDGARQGSLPESSGDSGHFAKSTQLRESTSDLFVSIEMKARDDYNDNANDDDVCELQALNEEDATPSTKGKPSSLHHRNTVQHSSNQVLNLDSHSDHEPPPRQKGSCSRCLAMFDFKLFKRPPFLMILVSCSLAVLPVGLYGMYLPAMAVDKGASGQQSALLLTIVGSVGIISRLGFGYLADLVRNELLLSLVICLLV